MGIFRTLIFFIYFFGYMIVHPKELRQAMELRKEGNDAGADRIVDEHVPHWCGELLKLAGVTITVEGKENIPEDRAVVFAANHRSYFDIPVMLTCLDRPHGIMAKRETDKIPLIRSWMKAL